MNKKILQGIETKKRILDCARYLFRENGYDNVTVDEIIKKAQSSKGSFYTHFKSKSELLITMMPAIDDAYKDFLNSKNDYENSITKISAFICYSFDFIEKEIGLPTISAVYSAHIQDITGEKFLISSDRSFLKLLTGLIDDGQSKSEIVQNLPSGHIASILISCMRGVIYDWCLYRGGFALVPYGKEVTDIMLNQLRFQN